MRRFGWTEPPDERRCTGTSTRTKRRCGQWAIRGGTVCQAHGGSAPQVKAAAARRVALADAIKAHDPRPPDEVLLATLHTADVLLRRALADTPAQTTPEQLAVVCGHLERAQTFARSVLGLGIEVRRVALAERVGDAVTAVLDAVLERAGLSAAQLAVVQAELPAQLTRLRAVVSE